MKVAVVGSGISGLTAAWALKRAPGVHVTMYERAEHPGMDSASVSVGSDRIDLPLRVFSRVRG
jgi:protoporphyrinogen oxidase